MKKQSEKSTSFTDAEKDAMKERAKELKAEAKRGEKRADGEKDLLAKVAEMSKVDRDIAKRLHEIITKNAPNLMPKTWYGMPAYANSEGKVVLFFRDTGKFKERYMTLGFNEDASLDEGSMWPVVFALKELTAGDEKKVAALVKKAVASSP